MNDREAVQRVMNGSLTGHEVLDARTEALVRIIALVSVDSDPSTFQWATEFAVAAGLSDDEIFHALIVVAPILGMARLSSTLVRLMSALDIDLIDE